jgi:hypothetical protein
MIYKLLAEGGNGGGNGLIVLILLALGYFLPSIIASVRKVRNVGSVIVVNLFLGWTFIGWVVALAMAARTIDRGGPDVPPGPAPAPGSEQSLSEQSLADIWRDHLSGETLSHTRDDLQEWWKRRNR